MPTPVPDVTVYLTEQEDENGKFLIVQTYTTDASGSVLPEILGNKHYQGFAGFATLADPLYVDPAVDSVFAFTPGNTLMVSSEFGAPTDIETIYVDLWSLFSVTFNFVNESGAAFNMTGKTINVYETDTDFNVINKFSVTTNGVLVENLSVETGSTILLAFSPDDLNDPLVVDPQVDDVAFHSASYDAVGTSAIEHFIRISLDLGALTVYLKTAWE